MPFLSNKPFLSSTALALSRIVYLGFTVIALIAFPEARKLLNKTWTTDGNTLHVSLVICEPSSIDVSGTDVTHDVAEIKGCFALDFLVNACAASLLLSAAATIIFLVRDFVFRYCRNKKGFNRFRKVTGVGVFLAIILLQTAFCAGALTSEADFWVQHFDGILGLLDEGNGAATACQFSNVKTHGNRAILWLATAHAFFAAFVVTLEHLVGFCHREAEQERNTNDGNGRRLLQELEEAAANQQTNPNGSQTATVLTTTTTQSEPDNATDTSTSLELPSWSKA